MLSIMVSIKIDDILKKEKYEKQGSNLKENIHTRYGGQMMDDMVHTYQTSKVKGGKCKESVRQKKS